MCLRKRGFVLAGQNHIASFARCLRTDINLFRDAKKMVGSIAPHSRRRLWAFE